MIYNLSILSFKTVYAMTIMKAINKYCFKDKCYNSVIYALPKSLNVNFCDKKGVPTIQLLNDLQQHEQVQQKIRYQKKRKKDL